MIAHSSAIVVIYLFFVLASLHDTSYPYLALLLYSGATTTRLRYHLPLLQAGGGETAWRRNGGKGMRSIKSKWDWLYQYEPLFDRLLDILRD